MEMVDMDITKCWFAGSNIEKCQHFSALKFWMIFEVGFVYFEKITFLNLFDMYLVNFDINNQYLVRFSQYLIKIHKY